MAKSKSKKRKDSGWRAIDGCPVSADIAPYIYLVLRKAKQSASSIYRGENPTAVRILHKHGKHTQAEIHRMMPSISNPAGLSEHELRSDGPSTNKGIAAGRSIPTWMQGVDSGGNDTASKNAITNAARHYGWRVVHPYARGVEGHHWRFDRQPRPNHILHAAHISLIRARLPRS